MIKDYFQIAIKELLHRRMRTWLTMIGIFIGIAAVVALISLGQGLQNAIFDQFTQLGTDKIIITPGGSSLGFSDNPPNPLTTKDVEVIKRTPGIIQVGSAVYKSTTVTWGRNEVVYTIASGIPLDSSLDITIQTFGLKVDQGRMLKSGDQKKVYVGYDYAYNTEFKDHVKIGDKISINGTDFQVVGINQKIGNEIDDRTVYISQTQLRDIFNTGDQVSYIFAQVAVGKVPADLVGDIENNLRRSRGVKKGEEDFKVETFEQYLTSFMVIFGIVQAVIVGIAAISLIVGGIGIMNTMYTSVLERTRDIGIMKAIGATNEDIRNLFLIESGMLGLTGGIIGVLLGVGLAKLTEFIGVVFLQTTLLQAALPAWLIIGSLAFAFILGALAGTLPAVQASKMNPVDALREE